MTRLRKLCLYALMVIQLGHEPNPAKRLRQKQGKTLRQIRVDFRQLSMVQVVERMSALDGITITQQAISQWERGETTPRPHLKVAICKVLDVHPSSIWNLDAEVAA